MIYFSLSCLIRLQDITGIDDVCTIIDWYDDRHITYLLFESSRELEDIFSEDKCVTYYHTGASFRVIRFPFESLLNIIHFKEASKEKYIGYKKSKA